MQTNSHQKLNRHKFLCLIVISALLWTGCNGVDLSAGSSDGSSADIPTLVDSSTSVWIEFPREGMVLDMKSYTFVVYGADGVGVSSISMFLNSEPWPASQLSDLSGDESLRQCVSTNPGQLPMKGRSPCRPSHPENPVASAQHPRCISASSPATRKPRLQMARLKLPHTHCLHGYPVRSQPGLHHRRCLQQPIPGRLPEQQRSVFDNTPVNGSGTLQVCPCVSSSYQLKIDKADGSTEYLLTEVVVNGSCTAPATPTFTTAPPVATTSAPPADTSGTTISYTNLVFESCKAYGQAEDERSVWSEQCQIWLQPQQRRLEVGLDGEYRR